MSKISLKVVVAGRTYPLTVNAGEEVKIQKAADDINKAIKALQENYAVKDMQDLLAMTALQLSTRATNPANSSSTETSVADYTELENQLEKLSAELDQLIA
ncbi:MAG: cell division protein ZapA [Bacteroidota bacterium]